MSTIDESALSEYFPDGPITSLRRVQTLYGALEEGLGDESGAKDPEFGLYFTPGELDEFTTTDPGEVNRYLVSVEIDLTADPVTADDVDVNVDFLTPDVVPKLGFSRFPWGRGIDHSITRRGAKDGSTASTVTTYCIDCLERWTNADGREPAIGDVADTHPDGWVIKLLQELGQDDAVTERIRALVEEKYADDDRVVATVRLRLDPESMEEYPSDGDPDWFYPGEVHVLNAAMKARKDSKLALKNTDEPSRGDGTCMVTGEQVEVFGTAEDPLAFFTIQHAEKFAEIKRAESWRSHPISSNAALLVQSGASLVETCRTTRNGLSVYTLPYFVRMTEDRARVLYEILQTLRDYDLGDTHPMRYLERQVEKRGTDEDVEALRFYVISLRNDSGDINVVHEVPDVSLYWPRKIATYHEETLHRSSAFGPLGFEKTDRWEPITHNTTVNDVVNEIVGGRYAWGTMPRMAGDEGAMTDDLAEWLTYALLTGETIPVERLLEGYVTRIEQEYRDRDGEFPDAHVKTQFAQLETLARAGILTSRGTAAELTKPPTMTEALPTRTEVAGDGNLSEYSVRKYRLQRFIEDRDSLKDSDDRRSALLLGSYLGILADHQSNAREMNRTLVDEYPADSVTIERLHRLLPKLTQRNKVYANDVEQLGEVLFPEYLEWTEREFVSPKEWDISLNDVRFFYSVGLAHGLRARWRAQDLRSRIEANESEVTAE